MSDDPTELARYWLAVAAGPYEEDEPTTAALAHAVIDGQATIEHLKAELARVQASAKFTQDQRCQVIEMCHELINRALMNEKYCAENDLPNYSTSHRLQESALRALLDERDRLADRVWQLEQAFKLAGVRPENAYEHQSEHKRLLASDVAQGRRIAELLAEIERLKRQMAIRERDDL